MIIFIDFDDVLFNTKEFSAYLKEFFVKAGIDQELFQKYYYDPNDQAKDKVRLFDPNGLFSRLEKYEKIDTGKIRHDFATKLQDLERFVFEDVADFLVSMGKENLQLISFGLTSWQQNKIKGSGIDKLVENFVITEKSKAQEIGQLLAQIKLGFEEKIFFIDDRAEHLEDVKKTFPQVTTIFLCRKEGRYCDQKNEFCDWEVHDLKEAGEIINNLNMSS
ncbi:MAG: HAD family hydrolase [Candidatus Moranbacteria bacterium]|nr:HAD family hydrolase [Candidatus Moranbacteria bacterium]